MRRLSAAGDHNLLRTGIGALCGFVATIPMTVVMVLLHRRLPAYERYSLPPRQVTMGIARRLGFKHKMDREERTASATLAHFGFGSGAGALYGVFEEQVPGPAAAKGILYGLLVWAGSYLGLLPALGVIQPATRHPARRNGLMLAAHVIWGLVLALTVERVAEESGSAAPEPRKLVHLPLQEAAY